jgi:hypothetical protein
MFNEMWFLNKNDYIVEPRLFGVIVGWAITDKWKTGLINTLYLTNYEKMYIVVFILNVHNVIFLMTIFEKPIANLKIY